MARFEGVRRRFGVEEERSRGLFGLTGFRRGAKLGVSLTVGAAVAITVVTSLAGLHIANASSTPLTDGQLVTPAFHNASGDFFSDGQVDLVWQRVTAAYPEQLPAGEIFSNKAPTFFHPTDGQSHLFQQGLVDEIAGRVWRCAWLGELVAAKSGGTSREVSKANAKLGAFESLPSIASTMDVKGYLAKVAEVAKDSGLTNEIAEFRMDCADYREGLVTE